MIAIESKIMAKKKSSSSGSKKSNTSKKSHHGVSCEKSASSKSLFDSHRLYYYSIVAVSLVVVLVSIVWNSVIQNKNAENHQRSISRQAADEQNIYLDSSLKSLVHLACQDGNCIEDKVLRAEGRTLFAGQKLGKHWELLNVPRDIQIWTLDALRDEFVKSLTGARHSNTDKFLVEQAFLAAYLAILVKRNGAAQSSSPDRQRTVSSIYLENLPTYEDYKLYHPVTFDLRELNSLYGSHTQTYFLVSKRKEEIESEYKAFARVSSEFAKSLSYEEYVAARLNVQARAFKAGPLSDQDAPPKELEWYKKNIGVDVQESVTVMVPILDAFNAHHKEQNVHWKYVPKSRKFVAYANKDIPEGAELFDTYGDRAE